MRLVKAAIAAVAVAALGLVMAPAHAVVDTTPPNVNLNRGLFFPVGGVLSNANADAQVPANLTWAASDDVGIMSQYYYYALYNANYNQVVAREGILSASARQVKVPGIPVNGYISDGEVYAYDAANNEGSDSSFFGLHLIQSNAFNLGAGWTSAACNCWSFGSTMKSSTAGASMQYQFSGTSIALIGDYATGRGSFKVQVNGVTVASSVSEAQSTKNMVVVWQKRFASYGTRTIKVIVNSGRVDVDALVVQS